MLLALGDRFKAFGIAHASLREIGEIGDGSDFWRRSGNGPTTDLPPSARTNREIRARIGKPGSGFEKTPPNGCGLNEPRLKKGVVRRSGGACRWQPATHLKSNFLVGHYGHHATPAPPHPRHHV